ncbi:MAG: hypothetical protein JYX80_11485 [Candidatus Scalindua sediminis]|nr:hypothetical protein [Candidatus Scalindua sediminis]
MYKTKNFNIKAAKGADVTPAMLAKINGYSMKTLTAEDVYVRKYVLANNGIDRDRERFPEKLLDDFARTLPGRSFLEVHDKSRLPLGLFFDASTEELSPEKFLQLTGEEIKLPGYITDAKVLWGWLYLVKSDFNEKLIVNLEAGIYRYISIGFSASDLKPVKGEFDQILYYEYIGPGEAREGSIVYLGAQPGATLQKSFEDDGSVDLEKMSIVPKDEKGNTLIPGKMSIVPKDEKGNTLIPGKMSIVPKGDIVDISPDDDNERL